MVFLYGGSLVEGDSARSYYNLEELAARRQAPARTGNMRCAGLHAHTRRAAGPQAHAQRQPGRRKQRRIALSR